VTVRPAAGFGRAASGRLPGIVEARRHSERVPRVPWQPELQPLCQRLRPLTSKHGVSAFSAVPLTVRPKTKRSDAPGPGRARCLLKARPQRVVSDARRCLCGLPIPFPQPARRGDIGPSAPASPCSTGGSIPPILFSKRKASFQIRMSGDRMPKTLAAGFRPRSVSPWASPLIRTTPPELA